MIARSDNAPKINIARSLTRLKSVFVTLYKDSSTEPRYFEPMKGYGGDTTQYKEFNLFYHPMMKSRQRYKNALAENRWIDKIVHNSKRE